MSSSKRIFIGSFIRVKTLEESITEIKRDFGGIISGRWVKTDNLHITFKFIGEVPVERVKAIKESLIDILDTGINIDIMLNGIGVFPNLKQPKILYIKVDHNETLLDLNRDIEDRLYKIGIKRELKKFVPHITINRIKQAKLSNLLEKIEKYEKRNFGRQEVVQINVIESILNQEGATYIPI